jgi:hypothetical protein
MGELQAKLAVNAKNRERRAQVEQLKGKADAIKSIVAAREKRVRELEAALLEARQELEQKANEAAFVETEWKLANKVAAELQDDDTTALKQKLVEIDAINVRVRNNLDREKALAEVEGHHEEYIGLQHQIEAIREEKKALLNGAKMPLEGLAVEDAVLAYNGHAWDCMSHAEQLIAATAICRSLNPRMGFVLIDKLEAMDIKTLRDFGVWLETEGLQAITTRVSQGEECSVIISDGLVTEPAEQKQPTGKMPEEF